MDERQTALSDAGDGVVGDDALGDGVVVRACGFMSGTSMDGIDFAVIDTDGAGIVRRLPKRARTVPLDQDAVATLTSAMRTAGEIMDRPVHDDAAKRGRADIGRAGPCVTEAHLALANDVARAHEAGPDGPARPVHVVGFHGQTVLHRPEHGVTWQIGDPFLLAQSLRCRVVADFRSADVAAGGEGAPLVPIYHRALVEAAGLTGPIALVNIGGVANVTWIGAEGEMMACDVGPGNAILNDRVGHDDRGSYDVDGAFAAQGTANRWIVDALLEDLFFGRPAPKSLDRNTFTRRARTLLRMGEDRQSDSRTAWDETRRKGLADDCATLTTVTVEGIARSAALFPEVPRQWIVCGGGARNPTMMEWLARRVQAPVSTADDHGWSSDFMEAEAFAYLAVRSLRGLPLSFPGTTGVAVPTTGGRVFQCARR